MMKVIVKAQIARWKRLLDNYLRNERGELLGTMGWMAAISLIIVLAHGLISGWLPDFLQSIFTRLETMV